LDFAVLAEDCLAAEPGQAHKPADFAKQRTPDLQSPSAARCKNHLPVMRVRVLWPTIRVERGRSAQEIDVDRLHFLSSHLLIAVEICQNFALIPNQ
jgi:hypothetical protein